MIDICGFYKSTIGKKVVVAVTGLVLFLFVIGHMLGNLKAFQGMDAAGVYYLDIYAHHLREMGEAMLGHGGFLWLVRIGLLGCLILHVVTVLQLQVVNAKAKPQGYKKVYFGAATRASRSMMIGGVILLLFVVYHIFHLTIGTLLEGFVAGEVYANVYKGFQVPWVLGVYLLAMIALGFHLFHGVWSLFQTLGFDSPDRNKSLRLVATLSAVGISVGFAVMPIAMYAGFLPKP